MEKMEKKKRIDKTAYKKRKLPLIGFSVLFSVCMVFGRSLDKKGSVPFKSPVMWIAVLILSAIVAIFVRCLWDFFWKWENEKIKRGHTGEGRQLKEASEEKEIGRKSFIIMAAVIFFCYLPVFLAVYPGFFVYDAQDELVQVISRNFSTHHPLVHVLLLGGTIQAVYKISGSYNAGIACYILLQMLLLSCIFSYGICRLKEEGMGRKTSMAAALYYGLFPVIVMFSLCSAKDGLFTGMLLLSILMLRELVRGQTLFFQKKAHVFLLAASLLCMMLLRHNGFYAFLAFAIVFLLLYKVTGLCGCLKKILLLFAGAAALYLVINQGLAFALHAEDSEHQEILTVPIQQLARVYAMEGDSLSPEEKEILYEILPEEALKRYTPKVSDGVKVSFCNEAYEKNPARYRKLWLKIGMQHPFAYLNAWFMTSFGFWYPGTVIDVYRGNSVFTFTYEDSSYFGYEVEEPGRRYSLIPPLNELYRKLSLEPEIQQLPILSWLFSPGFLFFVMMFVLSYFWYTGQYRKLIPWLLPVFIWLTVILGPTYLVRYVVFLWVLLPVLLWDGFHPEHEIDNTAIS